MIQGIIDGKLKSNARAIGSCLGTRTSTYECGGKQKYIKWDLALEKSNFKIESEFKVALIAATAVTFVLWSGDKQYHVGLDGNGNTLFYEGGSWGRAKHLGRTNLDSFKYQKIVIKRKENSLKVSIDGKNWKDITISASIDAIGWRPWRNTIHVKNLKIEVPRKNNGKLVTTVQKYIITG